MATYKVVVQFNVGGREELALQQIGGLVEQLGAQDTEIVVVAHGDGIGMVTNPAYADTVGALTERGVSFLGCSFSLRRQQMTERDLTPGAAATPGALAEIVRRQSEGYAYLRLF